MPIPWIKDCKLCNDGICIKVESLKGEGHNEWKSCNIMHEEAAKEYPELAEEFSARRILDRYRYHMGLGNSKKWHSILNSNSPHWWTPKEYIDSVREVMGAIDLDPASCKEANATVGAAKFYSETNDGLSRPWHDRIFLNPPYGKLGPPFIEKFLSEYGSSFPEGILLVNSRATDAGWFQPLFEGVICFTDHRIDFDGPNEKETHSTHGSCFVYFGPNEEKFAQVFSKHGNIVKRWP